MPGDSKTEKASPKKRRDERKKGNVFKSQDIITIVSLIGCFYALKLLFPMIYRTSRAYLVKCIEYVGSVESLSNDKTMSLQNEILLISAKTALPLLLIAAVLAILATGIQTRFLFTGKNLEPKFNRINPIEGLKKLFAGKNAVELMKNLVKITILIVILVGFIQDRITEAGNTMNMDLISSMVYILKEIIKLVELVVMWFIAIAGFDFLFQWWDYERQIKMSKQEVKEEYKQMEGNPEIKAKIKQMQQERARSRMMQAVPEADVIIRNPTHYAVALKYDSEVSGAPIVVAKGQDEAALRIVKVGEENHVFIMEDKPLARAIYASTQVNQEIPPEYYGVVAEILVYIYKLNKKELK